MSKFQKRHYEAVADILGDPEYPSHVIEKLTSAFVYVFTTDNHRFDPKRFLDAIQQRFEYLQTQENE